MIGGSILLGVKIIPIDLKLVCNIEINCTEEFKSISVKGLSDHTAYMIQIKDKVDKGCL